MVLRSRHTALVLGQEIKSVVITDDAEEVIESKAREQYRAFETEIKEKQRSGVKEDGFILYQDNVYQVYAGNGTVKKITGSVAKEVKRRIKLST